MNDADALADNPLVDAKELARYLRVEERAVRKWARSGIIPWVPLPNGARSYYRFHIAEVEAALRARKR